MKIDIFWKRHLLKIDIFWKKTPFEKNIFWKKASFEKGHLLKNDIYWRTSFGQMQLLKKKKHFFQKNTFLKKRQLVSPSAKDNGYLLMLSLISPFVPPLIGKETRFLFEDQINFLESACLPIPKLWFSLMSSPNVFAFVFVSSHKSVRIAIWRWSLNQCLKAVGHSFKKMCPGLRALFN